MKQAKQTEIWVGSKRRLERMKAVLPVRVSRNGDSGDSYCDLVHTLDISATGVRLGAVRRPLEVGNQIVLQYRQHKAEFRVIWIRPLGSSGELQVGLETDAQRDLWGLELGSKSRPQTSVPATSPVSIGA
jgi:PilZ domain